MDLMRDINARAKEYVPPAPVEEDIRASRLLRSMTPTKVEKSDKLDLAKKLKQKKEDKKHLKEYIELKKI